MDLATHVRALVDSRCPGWGEERRAERVGSILQNGICYLDADGLLCVRADQHSTLSSMLQLGHELPTRVSADALATLEQLRELASKGVVDSKLFRDQATVEAE